MINYIKKIPVFWMYFIAISAGTLVGITDIQILHTFGSIASEAFMRMFKCISMPMIAMSLIVTIVGYKAADSGKTIWKRAVLYTISTTLIAALISLVLYSIIRPGRVYINSSVESVTTVASHSGVYKQYLLNIIPSNIFAPFIENSVTGSLLFGIIIGFGIRNISNKEVHSVVNNVFCGIHAILLVITGWIIKIIPIGLFGFISTTVIELRGGLDITGIGGYLSVIIISNLIQGFVILPVWLRMNGIKPFYSMKQMFPALSLAFFSKSSAGTLPLTISTAEKNLHIEPKVSRFVLPLCTSINMNGCATFIFTTVVFLMFNHGIELSLPRMLLWVVIATVAAVGNAGVPMGCFFLSSGLLASMDIPIGLLGIILPFYGMIDMLETSLNVWSDSCVANVINHKLKVKA